MSPLRTLAPLKTRALALALVSLSALAVSGCVRRARIGGDVAAPAAPEGKPYFAHPKHAYRIESISTERGIPGVLGAEWAVTNLFHDGEGWVLRPSEQQVLALDLDGDGQADTRAQGQVHDLAFENRKTDAEFWLSSKPLHPSQSDKELRVLAHRAVLGLEEVGTTKLRQLGGCEVGGTAAFFADFDVLSLQKAAVGSEEGAVLKRGRLVLIRPAFGYETLPGSRTDSLPVLMVAGYMNFAEDFAEQLPAFEGLLDRLMLGDGKGTTPWQTRPTTCRAKPASEPSLLERRHEGDSDAFKRDEPSADPKASGEAL